MTDNISISAAHKMRHRWEMPLIWLSAIFTFGTLGLAIFLNLLSDQQLTALLGENAESYLEQVSIAFAVLLLPISLFIMRFYLAAKAKANAVRVGPSQFPQIWEIYASLGQTLDMKVLPKLYVTNGNGVVNAYALSCNTRTKYVVIHSEIALLIKEAPEVVEFVLAHELSHHKLNHVSLWRQIIGFIPNILVPLGKSTTRAQEYSADRLAWWACRRHKGAMSLLAVGPWLHQDVDFDAWMEQCRDERREIYVRIANVMSDHAVMVKRAHALNELDAHGLCKHGDMF